MISSYIIEIICIIINLLEPQSLPAPTHTIHTHLDYTKTITTSIAFDEQIFLSGNKFQQSPDYNHPRCRTFSWLLF